MKSVVMTERDRDVLDELLAAWDEEIQDFPLPGHLSYADVCDVVAKFGLKQPRNLGLFLARDDTPSP